MVSDFSIEKVDAGFKCVVKMEDGQRTGYGDTSINSMLDAVEVMRNQISHLEWKIGQKVMESAAYER